MGKKKRLPPRPRTCLETMCCCIECGIPCKSWVTLFLVYVIPIVILLLLAAACIYVGIRYRTDCSYEWLLPYWVLSSSATPFPLLAVIKGLRERYTGVTGWRLLSLLVYVIFTGWLIAGSAWTYDTWIHAPWTCDTCCKTYLVLSAFILTFVHWLIFLLTTVAIVVIITHLCCCRDENIVMPLTRKYPHNKI